MIGLDALLGALLVGSVLVVGPEGPFQDLPAALAVAQDGDTIEVRGGTHRGPIVVELAIELRGIGWPVLDGGGRGTVVTLAAPGAALRGFLVRGSGAELNGSDAGVYARAERTTIEGNRLEDVLFGISLDDAAWSTVRDNEIRGKPLPPAERGDGLRLWYSSQVVVEHNRVEAVRDCVFWYSENLRIAGNTIENGRYGLHFMYNDGAVVEGNVLRGNSVGAYLMYTHGVAVRGNLLAGNRGPSGLGLGLKDVDDLVVEANWLVDNRAGAYVDNSPTSLRAHSSYRANVFAFNDIGLILLPNVQRNSFADNVFRENLQQVSVQGGGTLRGNQWSQDGSGNFWSDYRGFDAAGDGLGDVPYRAEALLGDLMDKRPQLRLFQFGLAATAVEFAAQAFPSLRPPPKVVDEAPLLAAPTIPPPPGLTAADPRPALGLALGLLGLAGGVLGLSRLRLVAGWTAARPARAEARTAAGPVLEVRGLTKAFGRLLAVDGLDFSVDRGETVALWGANGAGKTTAVKCLLGLLPSRGRLVVAGRDARRQGKAARRALGYVPQEVAFHDDLSVEETLRFYARLKRVAPDEGRALLETLGLTEHLEKPIGALSGGLKQRLALALALLGQPLLLVLDEPTSNLDAAGREQVLRLLADLRGRGTAILFASHRLEEVEALSDRVIVLERGRLAFSCPPRDLAHRLGLHQGLKLRVPFERWSEALAVLRQGGLRASPNGSAIHVEVRPSEKALPIRLLESAGILVADFSLEDGAAAEPRAEGGPER